MSPTMSDRLEAMLKSDRAATGEAEIQKKEEQRISAGIASHGADPAWSQSYTFVLVLVRHTCSHARQSGKPML